MTDASVGFPMLGLENAPARCPHSSSRFPVACPQFPIPDSHLPADAGTRRFPTMGLTISYTLGLPASSPRATVVERVEQLRAAAERLPFEMVGPMIALEAGETLGDMNPPDPLEFAFRLWASHGPDADDPETGGFADTMPEAVGFIVMPGAHCEPAPFGLAWVPPRDDDWQVLRGQPWTWHWAAACKTQYASIVSAGHFVRCHTSIVALLDEAVKLGFDVRVNDEGAFWESRDTDRLLAHVDHMNRIVAAFAGAVHDRIGGEHRLEAPIFEHPDFERLETKALREENP